MFYKPGQICPVSGQYEIVYLFGEKIKLTGVERTVVKGEPFPPTPAEYQVYRLADKTKH